MVVSIDQSTREIFEDNALGMLRQLREHHALTKALTEQVAYVSVVAAISCPVLLFLALISSRLPCPMYWPS